MSEIITRRDFLQKALLAVAALEFPHVLTSQPKVAGRQQTLESAESLSGLDVHRLVTNSGFLSQEREPRSLLTQQFNESEYSNPSFENNACGQALIATLLKTYSFIQTGTVPDISIQAVRDHLESSSYMIGSEEYSFFRWDKQMSLAAVKAAIDLYSSTHPIKSSAFGTIPITGMTEGGHNQPRLLDQEQISHLIAESQNIFSKGGMVVMFATTLGGHLFLVSSLYRDQNEDLRAFVIDSYGSPDNREGFVEETKLPTFVGRWEGKLGLISAFGVYPTYT